MDLIPSPLPSVKIQIMGGIVCLRRKSKTLLGIVNKLLKTKVCWHHPAMFCLITSSKLSSQKFEFSLKMKVIGSNPGYLLIFFSILTVILDLDIVTKAKLDILKKRSLTQNLLLRPLLHKTFKNFHSGNEVHLL